MRGVEMDREAIEERAAELRRELADMTVPLRLLLRIEEMERDLLPRGGDSPRAREPSLRRARRAEEEAGHRAGDPLGGTRPGSCSGRPSTPRRERINLLRRAASLDLTRRLFALWHVFHMPFVWVLVAVFVLHVGVAIYFGYAAGGR